MIGILELWTLRDNFGIEFMDQKSNWSVEMMSIFLINKLITIIFFQLTVKNCENDFLKITGAKISQTKKKLQEGNYLYQSVCFKILLYQD